MLRRVLNKRAVARSHRRRSRYKHQKSHARSTYHRNVHTNALPQKSVTKYLIGTGALLITSFSAWATATSFSASAEDSNDKDAKTQPKGENDSSEQEGEYPIYSLAEVAKHTTPETGIWVTYKQGVYDVTEFVEMHPGGTKILLAAGASIEPFWRMYAAHNTADTLELLSTLRIGTLADAPANVVLDVNDPYANDPTRHPALKVHTPKPFNAETPRALLADNLITPNDLFFVRNHLPVPVVDIENFKLQVSGDDIKSATFTLEELRDKFPMVEVTSTVQCAGNRRKDLSSSKETRGTQWDIGAISTATWRGVRLADILKYVGVSNETQTRSHVQFKGLDTDPENIPYGASIPINKALSDDGDVIVALEMNGEPLPMDHGFPLRVVVPGHVGCRNVKWLSHVTVSDKESDSFWQQKDYKLYAPRIDWDTSAEAPPGPSIQELPVQSAITEPPTNFVVEKDDEYLTVKGYSYSGGGRDIVRVDVGVQGADWENAELKKIPQPRGKTWAWSLWEADVPIPLDQQEFKICVRAVDSSYNSQPTDCNVIWNLRGLLCNATHCIDVKREQDEDETSI